MSAWLIIQPPPPKKRVKKEKKKEKEQQPSPNINQDLNTNTTNNNNKNNNNNPNSNSNPNPNSTSDQTLPAEGLSSHMTGTSIANIILKTENAPKIAPSVNHAPGNHPKSEEQQQQKETNESVSSTGTKATNGGDEKPTMSARVDFEDVYFGGD